MFFTRQFQIARVYGIPVRIDYRWLGIFALSVWLLAANISSIVVVEDVHVLARWGFALFTTFLLFLSIFGHELAHAVIARLEGIETEEIVLHPFGGLARLRRVPDSPRAEFRIAIAGPAASFIFAMLGLGAMTLAAMSGYFIAAFIFAVIGYGNLLLAIFNLLPGYPLDGGRILRAALWHNTGDLTEATRITSITGQVIAWLLVAFGVYIAVRWGEYVLAAWSIVVGLFLRGAAAGVMNELRATNNMDSRRTVADAMRAPISIAPETLISHFVDQILPMHRQAIVPVAHERQLHGILSLEDLRKLPRAKWHTTRARDVMRPIAPDLFVESSSSLEEAERIMGENKVGALAVVGGKGELVGFLSRKTSAQAKSL
jgi:Zn-dependent protease